MAYPPESAEQDTTRVPESDDAEAVAHREVHDVARERPDAPLEAVAEEVGDGSVSFVEELSGDGAGRSVSAREHSEGDSERDRLAALEERIERLESAVTDRSASTVTADVEAIRLTLHACLDSDHISQEEELRIVRRVVQQIGEV